MLNIHEILKRLPHRHPMLLVDRILEIVEGVSCTAIKNITINEPQFQGHWPENPMFPGVLVLEALNQAGAVCILSAPENQGKIAVLAGVDGVRFRHQVIPGDQLTLEIKITRRKGDIGKGEGIARVDGKIVCEAKILFALIDQPTT